MREILKGDYDDKKNSYECLKKELSVCNDENDILFSIIFDYIDYLKNLGAWSYLDRIYEIIKEKDIYLYNYIVTFSKYRS